MGSSDRRPYETATVLDQALLDECATNLAIQLELTVDIDAPTRGTYTNPLGNQVEVFFPAHGFAIGDQVQILSADYPSAAGLVTVIATGHGIDTFRYDLGVAVAPTSGAVKFLGKLRLSDRNKYVGSTYYAARLVFPIISRTIGEILAPTLEFSRLTLEINNADGRFNYLMPAGIDYIGWVGARVVVKMGLRDVAATYRTIFSGRVTPEGGFQRTLKSFILTARNDFEKLNIDFPTTVFTKTGFPNLDEDKVNLVVPVVYGDWTVNVEPDMASVPAYIVNGADPTVTGDGSPHSTNVQCVISENDLALFDTTQVYVKRSSVVQVFDAGDIVNVGAGNRSFEIRQSSTVPPGTTLFDGSAYAFERGDEIFVKVKGKDLGAYDDNIVAIAMDILETYAAVDPALFHANWATYRDKAAPAQSAIATFKARCWIQEPVAALDYALSLLEQVRLEAFIDLGGLVKLGSLHFEDFVASPTFKVKNWDIEDNTFKPRIDDRTNINRARAVFNYLPNRNENFQATPTLRNDAAIAATGQEVSKKIVYPNLYELVVVQAQLTELLRLTSSYLENINFVLTWRALLLDIGDFVNLSVEIEGSQFQNVPVLIREIGYDPDGLKVPVRVFSFQLVPFPGWSPGWSPDGITGGYAAAITQE